MNKVHIEEGGAQETMLAPLYGRKLCAERYPTFYRDEYVEM